MSDLTDRIASKHTVNGIGGGGTTRIETIWCSCGAKTQSHVTEGYGRGFAQHIADVTEQAAREQIAASCNKFAVVEGEHGRSNYAEIWQEAAEIARGRS